MVRVRIPATTANLGPGFDVLGMALSLYNYIDMDFAVSGTDPAIEIVGEGKDKIPKDKENIVYQIAHKVFDKAGFSLQSTQSLKIKLENNIPAARGLGSSAAALVGGAVAANALIGNPLSEQELITMASDMEGHPDNVVPAMAGGITLCCQDDGEVLFRKINPPLELKAVAVVPSFELSTSAAREALPETVPLKDAVFNLGRLSLMLYGLQTGDMDLVKDTMKDRLHQPYRLPLVPGMNDVFEAALEKGAAGVALSGAGPTVLALGTPRNAASIGQAMEEAFAHYGIESCKKILNPESTGAIILV